MMNRLSEAQREQLRKTLAYHRWVIMDTFKAVLPTLILLAVFIFVIMALNGNAA